MILLIDNYDSFVHNLARYLQRLGQRTQVVRNDVIDGEMIEQLRPQAIVLSPGPCTPVAAGRSLELVRRLHETIPLLGVCLGHQTIAVALGGRVTQARQPMHGRSSPIFHDGDGIFHGLPSPLEAARYHSLVVDPNSLPAELQVSASAEDGTIMALRHRTHPVVGVQFHPESILTPTGYQLLTGFLRIAGIDVPDGPPSFADESIQQKIPAGAASSTIADGFEHIAALSQVRSPPVDPPPREENGSAPQLRHLQRSTGPNCES